MEKRIEMRNRGADVADKMTVQDKASIPVQPGASVKVVVPPHSIAGMVREGDDLLLQFTDGSTVRLAGYFGCPPGDMAQLFVEAPGGGELQANLSESSCFPAADTSSEPVSYSFSPYEAASTATATTASATSAAASGGGLSTGLLAGLGALAVGGGVAAAAGGGGGGNGGGSTGGGGGATPQNVPPAAPVVNASNGKTISGTAQPGSTVAIDTNGDGRPEATVKADANGNWTYESPTQIADATKVTVTAANSEGMISTPTTAVVDASPPPLPTVSPTNGTAIHGTAEPGSTVTIDYNGDGVTDATVMADASGNWTYTPTRALVHGARILVASHDAAGNISGPASTTVDSVAPAAPTVGTVTDGVGAVTGAVPSGGSTDDRLPVLHGTAEIGSTISVFDNGTLAGTAVVDGTGNWTFTPAAPLAEGAHSFTTTATDATGNVGPASAPFVVTVDTIPPAAPVMSATDGLTVSGTAEAGARIALDTNGDGVTDATATTDSSGQWSVTLPSQLPGGTVVTATALDAAGNASTPATRATNVAIDTTPPSVPDLGTIIDDVGSSQGGIANGAVTDDPHPLLGGVADPNVLVTIYDSDTMLGTTVANGVGVWSFTPVSRLTDGLHRLFITSRDTAGNESARSAAFQITVDTTAPAAPVVNPTDGTTVSGTAEAGASVAIDVNGDGTPDATVLADANGNWFATFATPLANGTVVSAVAVDAAGNRSPAATGTVNVSIDTTPPAVPAIGHVVDDIGTVRGDLVSGAATDDTQPALSGTADAGSTINIFDNGALLGTVVADGSGNWTFTPQTPLTAGSHSLTVTASDAAGNSSQPTTPFALTVDLTGPTAPVLTVNDHVGAIQGLVVDGGVTDDAHPVLAGTTEANATVAVFDNGALLGTTVADGTGAWTFTPSGALAVGGHSLTTIATDIAGNAGTSSAPLAFTVDVTPPSAPTISSTNGLELSGTAQPNVTINIDDTGDGVPDATVTSDGAGDWRYVPDTPIADGTTVTVTASDPAGNVSAPASVVVDGTVPFAPVIISVSDDVGSVLGVVSSGGFTDDVLPVLSGTSEAGATITLFDNGVQIGTALANGSGAWSFAPTTLTQAVHSFTATATDAAGNVSTVSAAYAITVDTTAPAAPILGPTDGHTVSGTAEAGATIAVDINGDTVADFTTVANAAGDWSIGLLTPLANGTLVSAVAIDVAGNRSTSGTATVNIAIDTTPPPVPVIGSVTDDVGTLQAVLTSGAFTDDTLPLLSGVGVELGATVSVYDNGALLGSVAVDGTGAWSFTPSTPLGQGAHSLTVTASDALGNQSLPSAAFLLTVDTIAPTAPTIALSNGTLLSGTAEAGVTVTIDLNGDGTPDTSVIADGTGHWSLGSLAIPDGTSVIVTAIDAAGNASGPASTVIDAVAPVAPVIASVTDAVGTVTGALLNGAASDDTQPLLAGTAEANASISVFDNGVLLGTVAANGSGAWSFTPPVPLGQGLHSFTTVATDATGNAGPASAAFAVTIDTTAPAVPVIASVTDAVGNLTGALVSGAVTDDRQPLLAGTAEANATVSVFNNGVLLGTALANGTGVWSFAPSGPLSQGAHSLTVSATDAAGNSGGVSAAFTLTVDSIAPAAPVIASVADDVGSVTGSLVSGAVTDDVLPLLSGTAEAGASLSILDNGIAIGSVTANGSGAWSFTPTAPLGQGGHSFTLVATDAAGNVSAASSAFAITVDTVAPIAPVIASLADDVGTIQGGLLNGAFTDDAIPLLSGTAEAGTTVSVFDNGVLIGTVAANGSGNWSFAPPSALPEGLHSFTTIATDAAGNASSASLAFAITVDNTAPAMPTINPSNGTGLSGTAEAGATVALDVNGDGTVDATVVADGLGNWSFTPILTLPDHNTVVATATDAAGNVSAPESTVIDASAPVPPAITRVADDVGTIQGNVVDGGVTDDILPRLSGIAAGGAAVSIFDNGVLLGTVTADGAGAWNFAPASLAQGAHSFTLSAVDPIGNVTASVGPYGFTVDNIAPASPAIVAVADDVGTIQTSVADGGRTDDNLPVITGTAEANATISIYDNGALRGTVTADGVGAWTFTPSAPLADGSHAFTLTATDAAGNVGLPSASYTITVDTSAPTAPSILSALDDVGSVQLLASGAVTNDVQPLLSGTAEAGATVSVFDNGGLLGTVVADGSGNWTFTPSVLGQGVHSFTSIATDVAGNASGASAAFALTVDITAPTTPTIIPSNGTLLSGTAEIGVTVNIDLNGDGTVDTSVVADGTGHWTYSPLVGLANGAHVIVTASDAAGNISGAASVIVDAVAPLPPILVAVTDDVGGILGAVAGGGVTDDALPVLTGTAEIGATVSVYDNGALLGTAVADIGGNWSFTPSAPLSGTVHSITTTATDLSGNVSTASAAFGFTLDVSAPVAPVIISVSDDVGSVLGVVSSGGFTDDVLPVLSGTSEAGATITLFDNGVQIGTALANGSGAWSFAPTTLTQAVHSFTATATDAAGNVSTVSAAYAITVDTTAPAAPILGPTDGHTVSGTAEAGATIAVDINGDTVADFTTVANAAGDWSIGLLTPLANGTLVSAVAIDVAGNRSTSGTATVNIAIDTTPPPVPVIGSVTDDVGTLQAVLTSGAFTDDTLPLLSGVGVELGATVSVYDNGALLGSVAVDGTGAWSFTPSTPLGQGAHSLTVTASDALGNQSLPSAAFLLTVDTIAPTAPTIALSNGTLLSGTAEAGVTVTIDLNGDGTPDTSVIADGTGHWSLGSLAIPDGTSVIVTAIDAAGNASGPASTVIDAVAPVAPVIASVTDAVGTVTGALLNGAASDDTQPLLAGTAEANASISVFDNGVLLGTVAANGSGAWSFTPPVPLGQGLHSFTTVATDATGNAGPASAAFAVTIDTTAPAVPVIASVTDAVGNLTGALVSGAVTDDRQPLLAGTAEANATVSVFNNGVLLGTALANGTGVWSFAPSGPLSQGAHSLTVSATDAAGNSGGVSAAFTLTVDSIAPAAPVIASVADDVGSVTGSLVSGAVTDDVLPLLSGTAEAGASLSILDNGIAIGSVTANGSGAWSFTPTAPLGQGGHSFTLVATDAAGNVSAASSAFAITVDTVAPIAPVIASLADDVGTIQGGLLNGAFTDDAIPLLSGTAEAGTTVSVFDNGVLIGTVAANGSGNWSFAPPSALPEGLHSFTTIATDAAGNASSASLAFAITVDNTAPAAPVIFAVTDDVGSRIGAVANGGATDDTIPLLTGTAEAGATVSIYDKGLLIGTVAANGVGVWNFAPSTALVEGDHSFTARATDAAGTRGAASAPFAIKVDTIAPVAPAITSLIDDVGTIVGPVSNGGVTNDTIPLLRGTAEAGTTLSVFDNGILLGTTSVDAAGAWSFSPTLPLLEGGHSFTARATDAAGNVGPASTAFAVTIDVTPPIVPLITSVTDDVLPNVGLVVSGGVTNDVSPLLAGTAAAGATVQVFDNGVLLGSVVANGLGLWNYTPSLLGNGSHSFTAVSVDVAGNASAASPAFGITVDTAPPAAAIAITALTLDTGTVGDWITYDSAPTISGTLGSTLGAGEQVEIRIDSGAWVSATAIGTSWFYGPGTLSAGSHSIQVHTIDAAGNVGNNASQAITILGGNQAPVVQASGTALLGLIGAEALGLLDLSSQSLTAFDPNDNLKTVQIRYAPLLSVNLGAFTMTASTLLAAELGLQFSVVNNAGVLNILAPSSTMTITAIDGGTIDNVAINELLNTVHFQQNITLLGLDVLSATTITATDSNGLTASSATGTLLDVSLLNVSGSGLVLEGNNNANTITGTAANERLYGHGGNDTLIGNDGNDLLRGGAGSDILQGGAGNDILVYDAADTLIDGGPGTDTLLIDSGTGLVLNLDTATNIRNIERIDLGAGDAGRQVVLTEAGVLRATDSNHQLIISGDGHDSVTMTGAVHAGQTLINGHAYEHFTLGTTTVFVEDPVMVVV